MNANDIATEVLNSEAPTTEYFTVTHVVQTGAVVKGDVFTTDSKGRTVGSVKVASKWTEVRDEDGKLITRSLTEDSQEVLRKTETDDSRKARHAYFRSGGVARSILGRTKDIEKVQAKIAAQLDTEHKYIDYGVMQELIMAQSELKVWNAFCHLIEVAVTNEKSSLHGLPLVAQFDQYVQHLKDEFFSTQKHRALSRSTNQVANLLEDADTEAVATFIDQSRWMM